MVTLPPELIKHVISYLDPNSLAPYASINRQWQALVENHIFNTLKVNTSRLADLQIIVRSRRCLAVRKINLTVTLPEYSVEERLQVETDEDRQRNNEAYTQTICTLFTILSSWPDECNIDLSIRNVSPRDWTEDPNRRLRRMRALKNPGKDILWWRYMASYVEILRPVDEIPIVHAISDLDIQRGKERNTTPTTVSKLISRLPRLSSIVADVSDNERKDAVLRDNLRYEFAISLAQWPASASLKCLDLTYPGEAPRDADYPPPKRSKPGADALSIALRQISTGLEFIDLQGLTIGPELFWPQRDSDSDVLPTWPNLTRFYLEYAAATPSGEWLFERDPRCPEYEFDRDSSNPNLRFFSPPMDDAPQDEFPDDYRTVPSPLLNKMYTAAALAAQRMPRLNRMHLVGQVQGGLNGVLRHGIMQCQMKHEFVYDRKEGQLGWVGSTPFPVSDETRDAWVKFAEMNSYDGSKLTLGVGYCVLVPFPFYMQTEN